MDASNATLVLIAAILDGAEWTADTCGQIAEVLRAEGYTVRDLGEDSDPWKLCGACHGHGEDGTPAHVECVTCAGSGLADLEPDERADIIANRRSV